jgi:pimeloyl-ACP methyl ester carboxylesterase
MSQPFYSPICFLHGLDSSPQGTKARLLRQGYPGCIIPELPPDIYKRMDIVEKEIRTPAVVIGSSLGGLTAVMFAMKHPDRVMELILLAPAVGAHVGVHILADQENDLLESLGIPDNVPATIITGTRDEIIPVTAVRSLARRSPQPSQIHLLEVDDDHSLHASLGLIMDTVASVCDRLE